MLADHLTVGPWRRRRRMMRALRELDRLDAGRSPRRSGLARGLRRLATTASLVLLMTVGLLVGAHQLWGITPTAHWFRTPHPLGAPPAVTPGVGTFAFSAHQPGDPSRPVAYDPCREIEYEVNGALAPPGSGHIVAEAVSRIHQATGLHFRYVGRTDRLPQPEGAVVAPHRVPVLIAWTTPQVVPRLAGRTAGLGGSVVQVDRLTGELQYVTGAVSLDAPAASLVLQQPQGRQELRAIVMHELGHVVGLAHVDAPAELMASDNHGQLDFGPGDREGLAALGGGHCFR
jgi:hypothetical protein